MLTSLFGVVGSRTIVAARATRRLARLTAETLDWCLVAPLTGRGLRGGSVLRHMVVVGFDSIPIVGFICALVGAILAMQFAYQIEKFGAVRYVPSVVGVAMTRELGPLIAAIIMAGSPLSQVATPRTPFRVGSERTSRRKTIAASLR